MEIGSVLEDLLSSDGMQGPAAEATSPERTRRMMVATEPSVRSVMLRSVHARTRASGRSLIPSTAVGCVRAVLHPYPERGALWLT
ncbi:DUF7509 family protein [Halomarina pelagica]|uniref:DUF7509 family protein n=1 Tax=Halomarina pelagica TaxID=2961599 RepID=UPI003F5F2AA2